MNTLTDFTYVLIFTIVAIVFTIMPVVISFFLAPRTRGGKTLDTYECGIQPFGSAWIRYSISYYIYALIFIAFDVDVLYLFPAALAYSKGDRTFEFYTILVFVLILGLGIIYAWGKGVFTWKRKIL